MQSEVAEELRNALVDLIDNQMPHKCIGRLCSLCGYIESAKEAIAKYDALQKKTE